MFTGLIEGVGKILALQSEKGGLLIEVSSPFSLKNTQIGDSIAVDGVCLTVINKKENSFKAQISPETLSKTTFKYKKIGDPVNLERALKLGDRLGGHLVSGHVDGIGKISSINPIENFYRFIIEVPENLAIYLVKKGSIAIDGISLTINDCKNNNIELMIIPHTLKMTTLGFKKTGDLVNIEIDIIAKMVYKWLSPYLENLSGSSQKTLSLDFLKEHGFI
ncbi:riboflavin synthase [Thermodesulfobacterium hydrogeniphilum]|uniref:riboflavin synthase n=1 Tax=Thermodesulfobacterium hydrogeniphilum TaxID=161156 RepID=UPI00056EA079|nr:riboflavin synthase [Thermodesulfobacterium hydrogeniphilum]